MNGSKEQFSGAFLNLVLTVTFGKCQVLLVSQGWAVLAMASLGCWCSCQVSSDIQVSLLEPCAPHGWEKEGKDWHSSSWHPVRAFRGKAPEENRTELVFLSCLATFSSTSTHPKEWCWATVLVCACSCHLGRTGCGSEGDELKQLICLAASSRDKAREVLLVWQEKHHELRDSDSLIGLHLFVLTYLVFLCTSASSVLEVQKLEVGWGYERCW